ncbi:MAG: hypothetical protein ABSG67_15615 [Thermoguttaceae bacterium]|jgi:hypothetical protein
MILNVLRLIAAIFNAPLKDWQKWNAARNGIVVKPTGDPLYDAKTWKSLLILIGEKTITSLLKVNSKQEILIPAKIRREIEEVIENLLDLVAVVTRSKRALRPVPVSWCGQTRATGFHPHLNKYDTN